LHLEVEAKAVANLEDDVLLLRSLETRRFGLDAIVTDMKVGHNVLADVVRRDGSDEASFGACDGDLNVGDNGPGRVSYRANDAGLLCKRNKRQAQNDGSKNKRMTDSELF
jgi:hypothetical protein